VLGTGAEGCGLGLAIVREIALSHGAEVSLTPGADATGTTVTVIFPCAPEQSTVPMPLAREVHPA
jgi:two-component system sensor histidine kinase TctE